MKSLRTPRHLELMRLLAEARDGAGLNQQQLARKLGRGQPFISKFENGDRRIEVIEFIEICELLGLRPERVIKKLAQIDQGAKSSSSRGR